MTITLSFIPSHCPPLRLQCINLWILSYDPVSVRVCVRAMNFKSISHG